MKDNIIQFPEKKAHECLNGNAASDFLLANDDHVACFVISLDTNGQVHVGAAGDKCLHYPEILCHAISVLEMAFTINEFDAS